jgi:hypothetical protein
MILGTEQLDHTARLTDEFRDDFARPLIQIAYVGENHDADMVNDKHLSRRWARALREEPEVHYLLQHASAGFC